MNPFQRWDDASAQMRPACWRRLREVAREIEA